MTLGMIVEDLQLIKAGGVFLGTLIILLWFLTNRLERRSRDGMMVRPSIIFIRCEMCGDQVPEWGYRVFTCVTCTDNGNQGKEAVDHRTVTHDICSDCNAWAAGMALMHNSRHVASEVRVRGPRTFKIRFWRSSTGCPLDP